MANEKILNTRIQLLGDFESEWTRVNPTLKANEAAISWDVKRNADGEPSGETGYGAFIGIKYGDGAKAWSQLQYSHESLETALESLQD
jgi:hypothetical protein